MNVQTDRALLPAGQAATRYVVVTVTAPESRRKRDRPALNVALVLDRSGSMAGRKIDLARQAVTQAIAVLERRDRLALVCYDTEIDTLLASTPASAEAKALAAERLQAIDARGGTDLAGGWQRGIDEVRGLNEAKTGEAGDVARRVLLLSDGLANEGETNPDVLARRAAELRAHGVLTSTFGLGADFDEVLMSRLAIEGGGHFYFIEHPAQIPDLLTSELGDALDVVARDARLVISGGPGVDVRPLTGHRMESHAHEGHLRLGDLVSKQEVTIVLAVQWRERSAGAPATLTLRLTDRDDALFEQPMTLEWDTVSAEQNAAQPRNQAVLLAAANQLAAIAREEAVRANRHGEFARAGQIIALAVMEIRSLGQGHKSFERLAADLEAEIQNFTAQMAPAALKEQHFASYNMRMTRDAVGKAKKRA